jgi:hypothetical protein
MLGDKLVLLGGLVNVCECSFVNKYALWITVAEKAVDEGSL